MVLSHALMLACPTLGGGPQLEADPHFPVLGTSVTLDVSAAPSSVWVLLGAVTPASIDLGAPGTLHLDPLNLLTLGAGVVPGSGVATTVLPVPAAAKFAGLEIFVQAVEVAGPLFTLTTGVALRIEDAPLAGGRATLSVDATPDGSKLYAAHRDDGIVAVVDTGTESLVRELPNGPPATHLLHGPVHIAVDPDGRNVFALNAAAEHVRVFDVSTDAMIARIPTGRGCKRIAFDFGVAPPRIYVTNEATDSVLVFEEPLPGFFVPLGALATEGSLPGPIDVLPDGRLVVGHQGSNELEILDPTTPGAPTDDRLAIGARPHDVLALGGEVLVAAFERTFGVPSDGDNVVMRFAFSPSLVANGTLFTNDGTDYVDLEAAGGVLTVTCAGSGTLLVADASTLTLEGIVDLAPGDPVATPQQSALVASGGPASSAWVANQFRETLRAVDVGAGAPFDAGNEVALAHSGAPRIAQVDLTSEEDGDWFLRSVAFFNGTAANPNRVTCATCHPDHGTDGVLSPGKNVLTFWNTSVAPPFGSNGSQSLLAGALNGAFNTHGTVGGTLDPATQASVVDFFENAVQPPASPFLGPGGALAPDAAAGKALFEGSAGCSTCHAAPIFVPADPDPPTIAAGVGTGLAPANVPSLRGAWASAPYFHDGSAATLLEVLETDTGDLHGATSTLTATEREQLAAYLATL